MLGKRTRGRKLWNNPQLLNSLILNTSLFLCKRRISQQPSRGVSLEKHNYKSKIFNLRYNPCGPRQSYGILKFVQVTECQLGKITKLSKKVKYGFKPAQWENIPNCFLHKNWMEPDDLLKIQVQRHKNEFVAELVSTLKE